MLTRAAPAPPRRQPWGVAARAWSQLQEPQLAPLYRAVLAAAGVRAGTTLLDLGCGAGLATRLAADRGARVSGVDLEAPLLDIARERTPSGDFRLADMMRLPYPAGSFDAVVAFNSVQFAATPSDALAEGRRVLRPSGRLALAAWGPANCCQAVKVMRAYHGLGEGPAVSGPAVSNPAPLALSAPGALAGLARDAGLRVVAEGDVSCEWRYPDVESALRAFNSAGPAVAVLDEVGEARVAEAVRPVLQRFRTAHGVGLSNIFHYVVAEP